MNNIHFNQDGGFRLSTNILNAVQASYSLFNALGWIGGNFTIISGCEVTGSNVSDGVVFINGEVFNFKGGNLGTNVIIKEIITNYPFQNGNVKPVIHERFVGFGTSLPENTYLWSDFKRLFPTKDIQEFKENHNDRITALENRPSDRIIGEVIRFDQPLVVLPPPGWEDFNPINEQGRVWVARSTSDSDFALGSTGGAKTHTLTGSQLPSKTVNIVVKDPYTGNQSAGGFDGSNDNIWKDRTISINVGGSDQAHNNLQPYIGVRFIKYIGL
ncbi:hypothetical protein [Epilithonimonas mollis]|uniref:Uncharacterized protein n=1 Tax=Epilithonimonas mollis TaxID=216903 RepID=A0A1M6UL78_9FLAO|nr:hypothetical protein [Epilithonimonas mollis]SHK69937.1 hypothetical protein SAMN05444371_3365 [Epilithonimonas mollis]